MTSVIPYRALRPAPIPGGLRRRLQLGAGPTGLEQAGAWAQNPKLEAAIAAIPVAGPFIAAGMAIFGLIVQAFGYDPQKLHDTAVVEAAEMSMHHIWYLLTGEVLPGIPGLSPTTTPGDYGAQGINLFQESAYPKVPYPAGQIPAAIALQSLQKTNAEAAQAMQRPESVPNLEGNYNYFAGLIGKVQQAQDAAAAAAPGSIGDVVSGLASSLPGWWPLAGAGVLGLFLLEAA